MLIPLILSGGAGTRLWPVSREARPKPFMKLADGESLLQKTLKRAAALDGVQDLWTVTNRDYYFSTKDEYAALKGLNPIKCHYLLEPCGRNTAPAIAMGALALNDQHGADALMLVLPADHLIERQDEFAAAVSRAVTLASQDYLVTFGIVPHYPETGYGYIRYGDDLGGGFGKEVARFEEKPSFEKAEEYVKSGNYLWNSGMFCFRVGKILEAIKACAPSLYQGAVACHEAGRGRSDSELDKETFSCLPEISIDYAVMEKAEKVAVVPGDFGWSDIGSWAAVAGLHSPDEHGNCVAGEAVLVDSRNCYVRSEDRLVGGVGLDNLIIVDTADALLVAHRDKVQDVRQVVLNLKASNHEAYRLHRTMHRPWGTYTVLETGDRFKIKRIVVKPKASLSLQMHYHRSEHWIVVSGTARVTSGDKECLVSTNESTYIPAGQRHRLENPGIVDLVIIEVQSGQYLEEDDIVRFDDRYGRGGEG